MRLASALSARSVNCCDTVVVTTAPAVGGSRRKREANLRVKPVSRLYRPRRNMRANHFGSGLYWRPRLERLPTNSLWHIRLNEQGRLHSFEEFFIMRDKLVDATAICRMLSCENTCHKQQDYAAANDCYQRASQIRQRWSKKFIRFSSLKSPQRSPLDRRDCRRRECR